MSDGDKYLRMLFELFDEIEQLESYVQMTVEQYPTPLRELVTAMTQRAQQIFSYINTELNFGARVEAIHPLCDVAERSFGVTVGIDSSLDMRDGCVHTDIRTDHNHY